MTYDGEKAVQCPSELHCFRWSMREGGFVDGWPSPVPGVVAQEPGFSVAFLLDGSRREEKFNEVLDHFVGKHHPEFVLNEVCKFVSHKVGVFVGRVVAATFDAAVLLFHGPWRRGGFGRDAMVPPLSKKGGGWVIDVV